MRTFAVSDIHGSFRGLSQCFERAGFDREEDQLLILGDICDGYPGVSKVFDLILSLSHVQVILGNHDLWALEWADEGRMPAEWISQGGLNTIDSYGGREMDRAHAKLLREAESWIELDGRLFLHAGFNPNLSLEQQDPNLLRWDRTLIGAAAARSRMGSDRRGSFGAWKEIFIGHTPTLNFSKTTPIKLCNVWDIDTGAGWWGPLTLINVETKEFFQSDPSPQLYPGVNSRFR